MKFVEIVEKLQKLEENRGKVLLARCGVFMVAIGKDAIFLNKVLKLNVTCIKPGICKAGIPVSHTFKYTDLMESMGYSYVIYDYDSNNKKFERKFEFEGANNPETDKCMDCKNCKYYKDHGSFDNIYIFDILEQREREKLEQKQIKKDLKKFE